MRMDRAFYLANVGHLAGQVATTPPFPHFEGGTPPPSLDDNTARGIVNVWRQLFPDAAPLPGIGLPSQGKGVLTLTHSGNMRDMAPMPPMAINGLPSQSPLANNALASHEISNGRWINLYEIMLPEIPGTNGGPSSVQRYVNALERQGIDVAGNHYHWTGGTMMGRFPVAIHSQSSSIDPTRFAQAHINALRAVFGLGVG